MTMEIIFDACRKKDFQAMEKAAFGLPIQSERLGKSNPEDPNLPLTLDNLKTEVPKLIAALARELGVENIDPKKLKSSDTLYALMVLIIRKRYHFRNQFKRNLTSLAWWAVIAW